VLQARPTAQPTNDRIDVLDFVEPRVRYLVAQYLGVGDEQLARQVSLTDDLAADSLDLLELTLALEAEFGVALPDQAVESVRTFGDLVDVVRRCTRRQPREHRTASAPVWTRIIVPGEVVGQLRRAEVLTPYAAETISEDAVRSGPGTRLEVSVSSGVSDAELTAVQAAFARLGSRGVQVSVRRDPSAPRRASGRPHAAA
jgi:acyl carrier protein